MGKPGEDTTSKLAENAELGQHKVRAHTKKLKGRKVLQITCRTTGQTHSRSHTHTAGTRAGTEFAFEIRG